ncbi:TonB-dependent siderophore receptor [Acinetobacter sp. YH12086]|uniref:TonB-dependent receptor n=1 Tax=Acinetobacter sp. YH12086 TaxID=2601078 RepID=UPI0015D123C4|nr:TonB-dependent siderophore receptor [Acinetobacter sp. YH12086]
MNNFAKTHLVRSITMVLLGVGGATSVLAADTTVLETIEVEVPVEKQIANGKLKANTDLGALGNQKIVDTPFSVTAYSEKLIEEQQAITVGEVLRNDASIRITTNQGHLNENFNIRGFDINHDDIALNGMYGMAPYGRVPTEFLDSVTVLKGPNALVAGMSPAGGVGGVVIAKTKPADKEKTQVSASMEEGGFYQSGFDVSRRFGAEKEFGLRVNGAYGQGEHIIEGMEDKHASGAIAADYTTDKLKLNFDAYAVRDDRNGGSPAMVGFISCEGITNPKKCTKPLQLMDAPEGDTNYFSNLEGHTNTQFAGLSGEYKFNDTLQFNAGVGQVEKKYRGHIFGTRFIVNDSNTGDATSQYYRVGMNEKNTTANFGVVSNFSTAAIKHTLGLRADYLERKTSQHSGQGATPVEYPTNIYDPSSNEMMPEGKPLMASLLDNKYISYTLTDQLSLLDDKLQLIVGARYQDIDTKNLQRKTGYQDDKISPSLGVVVKPFGENLSIYANYVEGLSEGVTVNNVADANNNVTFAPFQTKQYELGAKYQAGSWLNTFALYQIEKPSTMVSSYSDGQPNSTINQITTDDAETRSRGVEWAFSGEIYTGLNLMGSLAYIDAEYTKAAVKKGVTNQGNSVYGIPDFTATLGLDYAVPYVDGLNVNARANYVSEQYLNETNSLKLPDYTILDLGARYKTNLGGVNTTFLANIANVTDEKYWEGTFNSGYVLVGGPRTYKVGVTFDF